MTAPLKTVEASNIAVLMHETAARAKSAARVLALAPTAQKDSALATMAAAIRAPAGAGPCRQCRGHGRGEGRRRDRGVSRPPCPRRRARRRHGRGHRGRARARRSGRRGDRALDAAERHDHRARARAARRHRHHLREPPQRHRRRRRAVPEGRQCRDPARRLRQSTARTAPSTPRWSKACARPACRRPRSSSCRRATAPPSA